MEPTTTVDDEEEVVKEMIHGSIPRVDVVHGPASRLRFVVLKAGERQDISDLPPGFTDPTKEAPVAKSNEVDPEVTDPELVIKADDAPGVDDLDPTEVLADPPAEVAGDPNEPGSPAWEAIDAATARKWTSILSRAKNALGVMGDRELQEVAAGNGDGDDVDAAFDLSDACDAVDYAISILAPFAVDEQSEADCGAEALEMVNKSLGAFDGDALDLVEQMAPVLKAGRVLSASNQQAIEDAVTSLQGVLSSLPQAPTAEPVVKSEEKPVDPASTDPVVEPVIKAKGDDPAPMVAVYDASGNLLGACAQEDLTPLSSGTPVDPDAETEPAPAPPAPDDPAADPAAVDPAADPAAVDPAAVPAEPVAKSEGDQEDVDEKVLQAVEKALAKRDEDHEAVVKSLTDRIDHLEHQPAVGGPLLSGVPTGGLTSTAKGLTALRGQDDGAVNPEFAAVHKALDEETDPTKRNELQRQADFMSLRAAYAGQ